MEKSWSRNNPIRAGKKTNNQYTVVAGLFLVLVIVYGLLPILAQPSHYLWEQISESRIVIEQNIHDPIKKIAQGECIITATPPKTGYDVFLTLCSNADKPNLIIGGKVFTKYRDIVYWIGNIVSVTHASAMVRSLSDSESNIRRVSIQGLPEYIMVIPIGGGVFVAELPSAVAITVGVQVTDIGTGYPIGIVTGTVREEATLMQKIYVRIPQSFERLRTVTISPIMNQNNK